LGLVLAMRVLGGDSRAPSTPAVVRVRVVRLRRGGLMVVGHAVVIAGHDVGVRGGWVGGEVG
jgi:hypothetical protein